MGAGQASEAIKKAISEQFDAVTAKGDLEAAEKWLAVQTTFERAGELPDEAQTDAAVVAAVAEYWDAQGELVKAYDAAIKDLTVQKDIVAAKKVREESRKQRISNCDPIKQRRLRKELEAIADRGGWFWLKGTSGDQGKRAYFDSNSSPVYCLDKEKREFTYLTRRAGNFEAVIEKYSPTYEVIGPTDDDENIVLLRMTYPPEGSKPQEEAIFRFNRKTGNIDSPFGYFAQPVNDRRLISPPPKNLPRR